MRVRGDIKEADISPLRGGEENAQEEGELAETNAASIASQARLLRIRRSYGESLSLQEHTTFVKGINDLFGSNAMLV